MKGRDIIKKIMEKSNVSNATMAARLGITQAALWDRLNSKKVKDIPSSLLSEMLKAVDYKILIVPRATRVPLDAYELCAETCENSREIDLDSLLSDP